jgi:hypothetical protein
MSQRRRVLSSITDSSPRRQALIDQGPWGDLRWHYQHGRGWVNNKWSRIHKHGKIRRKKPPWRK